MKSIREASADARLLYQRLRKMEIGDRVSYAELNEIIGRDVQRAAYGFLKTARYWCERDDGKAFGVITNDGLKCLKSSEVIETSRNSVGRVRNLTRAALKRMRACVNDFDALKNEEKIQFNTCASILGVMSVMAKGSNIKKIETRVAEAQEQLPYAKTLEAFK